MASGPHALPPAVLEALAEGDTIEAIKRLRDAAGLGLKESRDLIEAHVRGDKGLRPEEPIGTGRDGGGLRTWLMVGGFVFLVVTCLSGGLGQGSDVSPPRPASAPRRW